jgi:hypothetical protein
MLAFGVSRVGCQVRVFIFNIKSFVVEMRVWFENKGHLDLVPVID